MSPEFKRRTASEYLKQLVSVGGLVEQKVGRERLFIHSKLIQLIIADSNEFKSYDLEHFQ